MWDVGYNLIIRPTDMQFSVHNLIRLSRMGEDPRANYGTEIRSWRKPLGEGRKGKESEVVRKGKHLKFINNHGRMAVVH
jgi:hypothetical protein